MFGNKEQKAKYLPKAVPMNSIVSFGLTEPTNGSDASGLQTKATKVKGGYLLNGRKTWIGSAQLADQVLIWAKNMD